MKRITAAILLIAVCFCLFALPTGAEGEVFVAAGNTVLPLGNAMPIRSSGVWYIDYQCFTKGNLNVSSSYNASEATLVLYTWDTTLIFDLNKAVAYTATEKVPYKAVAFVSTGTVYVPVQFTAQMLGLDYTYFSDLPMIRIKRSSDIPNDMFIYIAENEIPKLLEQYNTNKTEEGTHSSPPKPVTDGELSDTPDESENQKQKNIRITFNITDGTNMGRILNMLSRYGYRATFFVQGTAIKNCEDELRHAIANGHTLGTLSENGTSDFSGDEKNMTDALTRANEYLSEVTMTKTRLVRIPNGSKSLSDEKSNLLTGAGYRIWDAHITPTQQTATGIYNTIVSHLEKTDRATTVITLPDSDAGLNALTRLLRYLNTNKYRTYSITLLDTPVNDKGNRR